MLKKIVISTMLLIPMFLLGNIGYVANYGSNTISVFDTKLQKEIKVISVGKQPHGTWLNDNHTYLYVANMGSNTLSVINTSSNKKIKDMTVGDAPVELVSANGHIYTANSKSNTVSIIDEKTFKVVKNLPVGSQPEGMERSKDGNTLYVSNSASQTITVIDTKKQIITKHINIPGDAHNLRLSTNQARLYVTSPNTHKVIIIDTKMLNVSGEIVLEKTSNPVEILTSDTYIYVSCVDDGTLYKIDAHTHKITAKLSLGGNLHGLNFYNEKEIVLSHSSSNTLAFVNVDKMVAHSKVKVGQDPRGVAITTSFNPLNNATDVSVSQNLILTLNSAILPTPPPSSNITLHKTIDDSIVEIFSQQTGVGSSGGTATISGNTFTLNPNADLDFSTSYYIKSPTMNYVYSNYGQYSINDPITWTFTTEAAPVTSTNTEDKEDDEEEEEKTKLDHRVTVDGVTTRVVSFLKSAITAKLPNGGFRTTAGHIDIGNGYYILAVADTAPDGTTTTSFLKVNEVDPNDVTLIGYTYSQGTPFALGTLITIEKIDGILYIVIDSPINGTQLTVQ